MTLVQANVMEKIIDCLPSGILLIHQFGQIIHLNERARLLLGLPAHQPYASLGQFPVFLDPLKALLKQPEKDIPRSEITLQLPTRHDESIIGFSLKKIEEDKHPTDIWAFIFTDITGINKDQLAMDKIREELFQSKKLASIGTLVSGVAHEMNNPLTGISMSVSLAQMALKRLETPEALSQFSAETYQAYIRNVADEIAKIAQSCTKASRLVGDLLNYSRNQSLSLEPCNLHQFLQEMVQTFKTHPHFAQMQIVLPQPAISETQEKYDILCDKVKLEQVFYNLFKNSSDATEGKGRIELSFKKDAVSQEHPSIFYGAPTEQRPMVHITVEDNGPGIESTILSRVFDPFFTDKSKQGVGLGLSIAYRSVEQHGGLLEAVPNQSGAKLVIHLPLLTDEDADQNLPVEH